MKMNQEKKPDGEIWQERMRKRLELEAIGPLANETLKDLLKENGRSEEERELTPEQRKMIRGYLYNTSKMYLQVLREERAEDLI